MDRTEGVDVQHILDEFKEGREREYQHLLLIIRSPLTETATLVSILEQLQSAVSQLKNRYNSLITAVLKMNWIKHEPPVKKAYISFIKNLSSAHPTNLSKVLNVLVSHLSIRPQQQTDKSLQSLEVYNLIHEVIQSLQQIIPLLPRYLLTSVREKFPNISSSSEIQNDFIQNVFHITTYMPELREGLLDIIIHRITEIDVHCPRSGIFVEEVEEMDAEENLDKALFDMDDVKTSTEAEEGPRLTEIARALDCLMCSLFRYVEESCHDKDQFRVKEGQAFYLQLLGVFEKIILTTHSSSHVQFVMFYLCSFRKQLADNFLEFLWNKFSKPCTAMELRQTSASYIASFLSRANFVPLGTLTASLDLMTSWLDSYIDNQEESQKVAKDAAVHGPFYSLCQAVFYTIIYRYQELLTSRKGLQYMMGLNLDRIISCRLNPLMFCLPSVVNIFATISRKYQVAFCYTIMERNSRNIAVIKSSSSTSQDLANPLDTFFPFDPYMLPMSGKLIHPLYREWEGVTIAGHKDKAEEDEEEDFSQYEEHLQEVPLGLTPSSLAAVSPGFMSP